MSMMLLMLTLATGRLTLMSVESGDQCNPGLLESAMPFDGTHFLSTTQVLIEARRQIEIGWCQHKAADGSAVCILGALPRVRGSFHPEAVRILTEVIGCYPAIWQDMPGRTKEDVIGVYDRAIGLSIYV